MKKHGRLKAAAAAVAACLALQVVPLQAWGAEEASRISTTPLNVNLLQNPGFEQGTQGWSMPAGNVVQSPVYTGDNAAYQILESLGGFEVFSQTVDDLQAGVYELSGYVNSLGAILFGGSLNANVWPNYAADGSYLKQETSSNQGDTHGWKKVTVNVVIPFDGGSIRVHGDVMHGLLDGTPASCAFDDLSLKRVRAVTPKPLENMLRNPGFEQGMYAWTPNALPAAFTTNEQKRSGQSSLYLGYFTAEPMQGYVEQTHFNSGDGVYMLTAYLKTAPGFQGTGAVFRLEARDDAGTVVADGTTSPVPDTNGSWQKVTLLLYAPAGTKDVTLKIGGEKCVGGFYVDDLQLNHAPRK